MSFEGSDPLRSSKLPLWAAGDIPDAAPSRSRSRSHSSNCSNEADATSAFRQYGSESYDLDRTSPGLGVNFSRDNSDRHLDGYSSCGPRISSPICQSQQYSPHDFENSGGYSSGYDSSGGVASLSYHRSEQQRQQHQAHQQKQRYFHRAHSRSHSSSSQNSLSVNTGLNPDAKESQYPPGLVSLSSASSSSRGSMSDTGKVGGFFTRRKTYLPTTNSLSSDVKHNHSSVGSYSPHHRRQKRMGSATNNNNRKGGIAGSNKRGRLSGLLNDWDLLLPSGESYEHYGEYYEDGDGEEMNETERWKKRQLTKRGWESPVGQRIIIGLLVTVAVFVRIWKLAVPAAVVFDEQHAGGFVHDYLKGRLFKSMHPPLGKLLYSAVARLQGFHEHFDFASGNMRMFAAACGVGLVPISYFTIKRSGHSTHAAILCAILVTFENSLITQSRFIFLDAPMLLFMGYTMLAWINFYNHRNQPFTFGWWTWLLQTGLGLFLTASVKWVGLFTLATIGLCVLKYLQEARKHLYLSTRDFSKQLLSLCFCLIIFPCVIYVGLFLEVNRVMWWTQHSLSSPIHEDNHNYGNRGDQSHPGSWPFLRRGINYYSSKETNNYIYLIGNPLVWWTSSITAAMYMLKCFKSATQLFKRESGSRIKREHFGLTPFYSVASGTFFVGWAVHYAPFFFMDHHLYLYQYLPSLYFSILLFISRVDKAWQHWPKWRRYCTGLLLVLAVIYSWHSLSPLAYGTDFSSRTHCEKVRSIGGWEFVCHRQNLAYARPQAAAARIVIEDRAEHEKHEEAEEERNNQFYNQASTVDPEYDNSQGQKRQEDHEHDHEGPFNEEESEHYEHEHFRHPQELGHVDHNETPVEHVNKGADPASNINTVEEERRLWAEKLALDARQKELEDLLQVRQRAHEQLKAQDNASVSKDHSGVMPVQVDRENQHRQDLRSTDHGHGDEAQENFRAQVLAMQGQIEYARAV